MCFISQIKKYKYNIMTDFIDIFNNKLMEFLNELKIVLPELKELMTYEGLTLSAIMFDRTLPYKTFTENVLYPYGSYIENKDEKFLLENEYNIDIDNKFIDMIKRVWKDLDEENKQAIWTYMKLLIAINKKILS